MLLHRHSLTPVAPGTSRELHSLHFGPAGAAKVLIQASLHADEPPGMLVVFHLRQLLAQLEAEGLLRAEIVLLPTANPIGLAQRVLGRTLGRFALANGENFNRYFADLSERAFDLLQPQISSGNCPDQAAVKAALRQACSELPADSELQSLRKILLGLAVDADLVLDLHCDNEAVLHLYAATPQWPSVEPLARALGMELCLLATDSGDAPFDESCSMLWARLNARYVAQTGLAAPWPLACTAVTIELRGEADVEHALALRDAHAVLDYLRHVGWITGTAPVLPPLKREPRPLQGSIPIHTPVGGVLVHRPLLGAQVRKGELIAEVVDVLSGVVHALHSPIDGLLYARESVRSVQAGMSIAKVAGLEALRSGRLLSD
jgi:predicted deacylase